MNVTENPGPACLLEQKQRDEEGGGRGCLLRRESLTETFECGGFKTVLEVLDSPPIRRWRLAALPNMWVRLGSLPPADRAEHSDGVGLVRLDHH